MTLDLDTLDDAALDRLTTMLVQSGHLSHPLRLQAFVETDLTQSDLKAALQDLLPAHMVPDRLELAPKLARLPNGKLDRKALTASTSPEMPKSEAQVSDSEILETLRGIWADVLGMDQVLDDDDFFEIGGDSLLSISVVSRARAAGLELIPTDLFDYSILKELASRTKIGDADQKLADIAMQPLDVKVEGDSAKQMFILNANRRMLEHLNDQLETRHELHLMTLHWDSGNVDSRTTVSGVADEFIERIRNIQPVGPYSLGGFSMGAVAAHEIALKLQAQGEEIAHLLMIDPPENPKLFAKVFNSEHKFEGGKEEELTLKRRLVNRAVVSLAGLARALSLPLPDKLRQRLAGAAYLRASRHYEVSKPAVSPVIVRRKISQPSSIWASAEEGFELHQIACSHHDFHRDDATIEQWTGLLAQSLNGSKP